MADVLDQQTTTALLACRKRGEQNLAALNAITPAGRDTFDMMLAQARALQNEVNRRMLALDTEVQSMRHQDTVHSSAQLRIDFGNLLPAGAEGDGLENATDLPTA